MSIRVFELARELEVTSKDVLEKCRAEGISVPNHMTALSAGLEATIRDWFSEAPAHTAVETTVHVDLETARKKAATQRRRRKKEEVEAPAVEPAVAEAPPAPQVEAASAEAVAEMAPAAAAPEAEAPPAAPAAEAAIPTYVGTPEEPPVQAEAAPEKEQKERLGEEAKAVPNEPTRPKIVKPAGPQLVPRPAKLQGPRVVRFDGAEPPVPIRRAPAPPPPTAGPGRAAPAGPGDKKGLVGGGEEEAAGKKGAAKRRSPRRKSGRVADTTEGLREWRDRDLAERSQRLAAATGGTLRRHRTAPTRAKGGEGAPTAREAGQVEIWEPITVKGLSQATGMKITDILRKLVAHGVVATINSALERGTAETICLESGIELVVQVAKTAEDELEDQLASRLASENLHPRAPIVTFLGHVDHGKTSLLDRIRNARVAAGEEGGITQGIGAYRFDQGDRHVVFLDTPGHEAFTAMRSRGANMTDVVVLVVAADDGVMPQTVEALSHAKAAKVPVVVALNKIDLPNANVQRVLGQLAEHELNPREWGGNVEVIRTSAATGEGIDALVELLSLEAEMLELKADPTAPASGWVVEARLDPTRGILSHLLVRDGVLKVGDVVLCGRAYGRVRSLSNDLRRPMESAGPSTPVEVTGLDKVPEAGDRFCVVESIAQARKVVEERRRRQRSRAVTVAPAATLENIFQQIESGQANELRLILKVDVQGSLEALNKSLQSLHTEDVKVTVLHAGVGGITEGDVLLAEASDAIIMGFRVVPDGRARALAELQGVEVRTYRVIYQLLEHIEKAVKGLVAPEMTEKVTGRAEVREVFKVSRVGNVAGGYVLEGVITRSARVRLIRNNVMVEDERQLESLRRFKEDVREVRAGLECGMKIAGYDDIKTGDIIEAYQSVEVGT